MSSNSLKTWIPILIAVLAAMIYAEPLDPLVLLGGAVIFAGILINIRSELRSNQRGKKQPVP